MQNNFKYIQNISEDEATILLYNQIGSSIDEYGNLEYGIDGSSFANEMLYLQDKCKKINVRINSIGGNVIDGYSIISSILNSKAEVNTYIDGLAASIAGLIAVAGNKCYMMDYGTLMLHNPSGGGDKNVLDLVKSTLVTIFKSRTKKSEDEIAKMMDKETWMDAKTALNEGFVDEIVSSGKSIKINQSESLYNMAIIYNKLINPKKMKQVTDKLGLDESTAEDVIASKIAELQNAVNEANTENERIKSELATAQEKLNAYEAEKVEAENAKIEEMVNSFNVKEEEKENLIKLAKVDFESVKNLLSKSTVKEPVKVFDFKNVETKKGIEDRSGWNLRDWEKKDSKGLEKLRNESPETYELLYEQTYKNKK